MSRQNSTTRESFVAILSQQGYWPARAARYLADGQYSKAVEICREQLTVDSKLVSGRLAYATALELAGQAESAGEQFHHVLSLDPTNMVALKHLGDIRFAAGDEMAAMAYYRHVLEIDPCCRGLKSDLNSRSDEITRTITLKHSKEVASPVQHQTLRDIPFYTETIGDLYLAQGHPRLAANVFRRLNVTGSNPRLQEKLRQAEHRIREKETRSCPPSE